MNGSGQRRPETGPMRFGSDHCGVFIRGDEACAFGETLRILLGDPEFLGRDVIQRMVFTEMSNMLMGALESKAPPTVYSTAGGTQVLKDFELCVPEFPNRGIQESEGFEIEPEDGEGSENQNPRCFVDDVWDDDLL